MCPGVYGGEGTCGDKDKPVQDQLNHQETGDQQIFFDRGMLLNAHEFQNQMECEKWGYSPPFVYCKAFTPLNSAHRSSYDAFESAV